MSRTVAVLTLVFGVIGALVGYGLGGATRLDVGVERSGRSNPEPAGPEPVALAPASAEELEGATQALSALGSITVESEPRDRSGSITGRVLSLDGEPVADMGIRARCNGMPKEGGLDNPLDGTDEEWILQAARTYRFQNEYTVDTKTGTDGRFVLEGIAGDLEYYVYTPDDGVWILDSETRNGTREVSAGAELEHVAIPLGDIEFDVRNFDASKSPFLFLRMTPVVRPEGELTSRPDDLESRADLVSSMVHRWRPDDRKSYAPEGLCRISVQDESHALEEPLLIEVIHGQTVTVQIDLLQLHRVYGQVALGGLPLTSGRLHLVRGSFPRIDDPELLQVIRGGDSNDHKTEHLSGGQYQFEVDPGTYTLCFGRGYGEVEEVRVVEVDADLRVDFDLELDLSKTVRAKTTDASGKPVSASFQLAYRSRGSSGSRTIDAQEIGPGDYRLIPDPDDFEHLDADDLELALSVSAARYGTRHIDVDLGQSYEIRFEEPGSLLVDLVGLDGHPHRDRFTVDVVSERMDGDENSVRRYRDDDDLKSEMKIDGLAPGEYTVVLSSAPENEWQKLMVSRTRVVLSSGENRITVPVPALHDVTVRVAEDDVSGNLSLRTAASGPVSPRDTGSIHMEAKDGAFRFRGIPTGVYELQVWGRRGSAMKLDVRGDMVVDFEPQTIDRLRVEIDDTSGDLATMGFQNGDQVVAIDGERFSSEAELMQAFMRAFSKTSATLTVLRNGQEIALTVDPKKTFQPTRTAGGTFEPDGE